MSKLTVIAMLLPAVLAAQSPRCAERILPDSLMIGAVAIPLDLERRVNAILDSKAERAFAGRALFQVAPESASAARELLVLAQRERRALSFVLARAIRRLDATFSISRAWVAAFTYNELRLDTSPVDGLLASLTATGTERWIALSAIEYSAQSERYLRLLEGAICALALKTGSSQPILGRVGVQSLVLAWDEQEALLAILAAGYQRAEGGGTPLRVSQLVDSTNQVGRFVQLRHSSAW